MSSQAIFAIISVLAVSSISALAAIPFLGKKQVPRSILMILLSISVGTLLGTVFFHFLPEIINGHDQASGTGFTFLSAIIIVSGFLAFFLVEKTIHHHHEHKKHDHVQRCTHSHAYHLAPLNIIGNAIHNFLDGIVIAATYAVSFPVGIATTIAIMFHEIPKEISDMGVLVYSGLTARKALAFNILSALFAVVGTIIGIIFTASEHLHEWLIPFAAGNFLYIAAANLVPELHQECNLKDDVIHVLCIVAGLGVTAALSLLGGH